MCWDCVFCRVFFFLKPPPAPPFPFPKSVHQFANYSLGGGGNLPTRLFSSPPPLSSSFLPSLSLCTSEWGERGGPKKCWDGVCVWGGGIWHMSGECYLGFLWALFFSGNKEQLLFESYSKSCTYFHCCVALLIKHLFLLLLMSLHNCLQTNLTRKRPTYSLCVFSWGEDGFGGEGGVWDKYYYYCYYCYFCSDLFGRNAFEKSPH